MARRNRDKTTPREPGKGGRIRVSLFDQVLNDPNPVIRYGFAALLFFGPLYLMSSYGIKGAGWIALAGFLGVILYRQNHGGLAFT